MAIEKTSRASIWWDCRMHSLSLSVYIRSLCRLDTRIWLKSTTETHVRIYQYTYLGDMLQNTYRPVCIQFDDVVKTATGIWSRKLYALYPVWYLTFCLWKCLQWRTKKAAVRPRYQSEWCHATYWSYNQFKVLPKIVQPYINKIFSNGKGHPNTLFWTVCRYLIYMIVPTFDMDCDMRYTVCTSIFHLLTRFEISYWVWWCYGQGVISSTQFGATLSPCPYKLHDQHARL